MPNKAGTEPLSFSSLTRDRESDRIIRDLTFDEAAYITAERMARASAINADETKLRDSQIGASDGHGLHPENIPPIPQFLDSASHAASTLHITVSCGGLETCREGAKWSFVPQLCFLFDQYIAHFAILLHL